MEVTLELDDALLREAKAAAARAGTPLARVVEESLRDWLAVRSAPTAEVPAKRSSGVLDLEPLLEKARLREQNKTGGAGPFSRAETYIERLDRFR